MPLKVLMSLLWSAYLPVKKRKDLDRTWQRLEVIWNLTDTDLCIAYIRNQILVRYSRNLFPFLCIVFSTERKKKLKHFESRY